MSPLATSPRPPLTLAASSKGAWACCGACNVCSRPGPAAPACPPRGVSSASSSDLGETIRPLLLAQGQSPRGTHPPHPTESSLCSVTPELGCEVDFSSPPVAGHGCPQAWEHLRSPPGPSVTGPSCAQGWAEMEVMQYQDSQPWLVSLGCSSVPPAGAPQPKARPGWVWKW